MANTIEKATSMLLRNKKYHEVARQVFPILVRQARLGKYITYSEISDEIDYRSGPRNLNYPLGSIGVAMADVGKILHLEVPSINLLAIGKLSERPGTGAGSLYSSERFLKLPKWRQQEVMRENHRSIFEFEKWDRILDFLGLKPSDMNFTEELEKARCYSGEVESQEHIDLKEYVRKNPHLIGLVKSSTEGVIEFPLLSGDQVDVYFKRRNLDVAVEVKPSNAPEADLIRGVYQCVKYKAIIEATQLAENRIVNARAVLVTTAKLPLKVVTIKNILGVEALDQLLLPKKS